MFDPEPRRLRRPQGRGCLVGIPVLLLALSSDAVQGAPPPPSGHPTHGAIDGQSVDTVASLAVRTLERAPVVAVALAFPAGSGRDPEGGSGAATLLARSLEERIRESLPGGAALVSSRVERDVIAFSVVTPPADWPGAWAVLRRVLYAEPLPEAAVERAREAILGPLRFERGAPVRLFELEADRLALGTAHPWARPIQGTEAEVAAVTARGLDELRREWLRPGLASMTVVGPLDRNGLRGLVAVEGEEASPPPVAPVLDSLGGLVSPDDPDTLPPASTEPVPAVAPSPEATPPALLPPAWTAGERRVLERNVVNSWVAVAWPAPPNLDRHHLAFAAHVVRELLTPVPADPGLFSITSRVEATPDGPMLRVVAAVLPGQTARWEERILAVIPGLLEAPPPDDFLAVYRRRFAGETLLALSLPEEEALTLAIGTARGVAPTHDPGEELPRLGSGELVGAVASLGPPRVLVYGPP